MLSALCKILNKMSSFLCLSVPLLWQYCVSTIVFVCTIAHNGAQHVIMIVMHRSRCFWFTKTMLVVILLKNSDLYLCYWSCLPMHRFTEEQACRLFPFICIGYEYCFMTKIGIWWNCTDSFSNHYLIWHKQGCAGWHNPGGYCWHCCIVCYCFTYYCQGAFEELPWTFKKRPSWVSHMVQYSFYKTDAWWFSSSFDRPSQCYLSKQNLKSLCLSNFYFNYISLSLNVFSLEYTDGFLLDYVIKKFKIRFGLTFV